MNRWEHECNKIEDNDALDDDEQFVKQRILLERIFSKYCTVKERLNGRPNSVSFGSDDSFEYDPKQEKIISIEQEKANRMVIKTNRKMPMNESFMYVLLKEGDKWLLDSKKRESSWEKRWKVASL